MRILHISTRLIIGGSQENTFLSCRGQVECGHEVHLAFGPIVGPEGSMRPQVESYCSSGGCAITCHEVPDLVREVEVGRDRRCLRQLRRLIRELDPDIVHTHSSKAGILGRIAAWREGGRRGRPGVIHTVHGPPFHRHETIMRNEIYALCERYAARRCHRILTVCDMMRTQFLANRIGRPGQYATVYSGVDVASYGTPASDEERRAARRELRMRPDAIIIGTVSRLADLKGHADIIKALTEKMREHPEWMLLWVGDGWLREDLEASLRHVGMRERVHITGMLPPEEVPGMIRAMDVLLHPSYREGLPRAVVQALLAGVPVVATSVDGTPEAVLDGVTGSLFTPGDLVGMRKMMKAATGDLERAREGALKGRRDCLERFDARRMVEQLESIYQEVLHGEIRPDRLRASTSAGAA